MILPKLPANETARLAALRSYDVLDTEPEPEFDALVELAAFIMDVPMALVSLVVDDRQWFKANKGLDGTGGTRADSFCAHVVGDDAPLFVADALADERFHDNPFVVDAPRIRFYAGIPLRMADGHVLGSFCTLDSKPRTFTAEQRSMLELLAKQAVTLLEARRRNLALRERERDLAMVRSALDQIQDVIFIYDLKTRHLSYVNEGATRQLGFTRDELLGMTPHALTPERELPKMIDAAREAMGQTRPVVTVETIYRDRTGNEMPVEVALQYIADTGALDGRFISVARDISERKRVEQMQSEFVSTVSHELRTPLTSIRGSLGLVAAGITGALPDEAKEYVDIALSNSERLVRLINDILDVEKMQSGKMEFRMLAQPLVGLVQHALASNQPAGGSRLVLTTAIPDVEVVVDGDRFAQVIANLVSNAAKFAPADSQIELAIVPRDRGVRIAVTDHGPGIPEAFASRIFQRFSQAESSSTRAKGGTGLGLAICKAIVEHMRGEIGFEPVEPTGTRFFVDLPALSRVAAESQPCPRVLVCEDDPGIYQLIERTLVGDGYAVDIAPTLERARRLIAAHRYDAITLDLVLADGDGSQLLADLKRTEAATPVIVVSGTSQELGRASVLVTDVIAKPFGQDRLLEAVQRVVKDCAQQSPRVLHVEDDDDVRRIVKRTLPAEWRVTGATNLAEAKQRLAESPFDALIVDLALPDGCGADLISLAGSARVVIFSAHDVELELSQRVSAALVKTRSTPDELRAVVASLVHGGTR